MGITAVKWMSSPFPHLIVPQRNSLLFWPAQTYPAEVSNCCYRLDWQVQSDPVTPVPYGCKVWIPATTLSKLPEPQCLATYRLWLLFLICTWIGNGGCCMVENHIICIYVIYMSFLMEHDKALFVRQVWRVNVHERADHYIISSPLF